MWRSDLIPLMEDGVKIQSVAVNAYSAALQESAGVGGDFIIVEDLAKIKDPWRQDARDPEH